MGSTLLIADPTKYGGPDMLDGDAIVAGLCVRSSTESVRSCGATVATLRGLDVLWSCALDCGEGCRGCEV